MLIVIPHQSHRFTSGLFTSSNLTQSTWSKIKVWKILLNKNSLWGKSQRLHFSPRQLANWTLLDPPHRHSLFMPVHISCQSKNLDVLLCCIHDYYQGRRRRISPQLNKIIPNASSPNKNKQEPPQRSACYTNTKPFIGYTGDLSVVFIYHANKDL